MKELGSTGDSAMHDQLGEPAAGPNPLLIVHRALRGRYLLAAVLGLLLAIPGAVVGYTLVPPAYTSRAVLEAAPTLPALLYENELNENLPAFDAFVRQQATSLNSERVLNNALLNDELRAAGWPTGAAGLIRLRRSLEISTPSRSNQIFLSVTDEDPNLARIAAKAVLGAYEDIRREYEATTFGERERRLEKLRTDYLNERDQKRRLALNTSLREAGTEDLQAAQEERRSELATIDQQLAALRASASSATPEDASSGPGIDPELAQLTAERRDLQQALNKLLQTVTPEHREARWARAQLRAVDAAIAEREDQLAAAAGGVTDALPSGATPEERASARAERVRELEERKRTLDLEIRSIAQTRLEILALGQEADEANARFEDAERRLESLRVEKQAQIVGRIRVAQEPERPLQPSTDRRVPLAGMGFMGGAGMGVAAVALFGLLVPKLRIADDISSVAPDFALLGMVPEFTDAHDEQTEANVQDSLHFLRVMLDARSSPGCLVLGVTSPQSGDGKTTISRLLARSFALTRRRVLIIDADMVGRGLTRSLNVTPRHYEPTPELSLSELVVRIEGEAFHMLPASESETASDSFCRISLHHLLLEARQSYDVVLLDSGPILGSIEASAMVPIVDQNLLIVSRGLDTRMLRMATARLRSLNARSVGVVFNKANSVDYNRSFAPTSSVSRRNSARPGGALIPTSLQAADVMVGEERKTG